LTRRTVQEEVVCDRCGRREIVEGFAELDLTLQTSLSKLFPVWKYRKPEGWMAVGDTTRLIGASDYCPQCAKELEEILTKFYKTKDK